MKKALLTFSFTCISYLIFAQFNMTLISQLEYPGKANDIWGYVASDGTEYALVGLRAGVSIVSLADPATPEEVAFIEGPNSTWRDIKTWGEYAYVTTDQPGTQEGLLIIDLSDLPNSVNHYNWTPDFPDIPGGELRTCHNLFIDENGYCYLAGCNLNDGGMIILDVFTEPGFPQYVAPAPPNYAHDVYVRNNKMYGAEIYAGEVGIYDVFDKENITQLASQETPFEFTHNVWLSDNSEVLFTTDEKANAPVAAYDISDLTDIQELDQFRPINTLGAGVIPHNVHVWNDYLIISYYTDGAVIVDAAKPDNLIEVGSFDTFLGADGGFSGAWGAYPFLPSGLVLVSDINSGLYVLEPDYKRACYLEGTVTDANSGFTLSGVEVKILSADPNTASTDLSGNYKTGQATGGSFEVRFSKAGYKPVVQTVNLNNGELLMLDVEMEPVAILTGLIVRTSDETPIPNAHVQFYQDDNIFTAEANGAGEFQAPVDLGQHTVVAGSWGFLHYIGTIQVSGDGNLVIELSGGYQDDFIFDQGWNSEATSPTGHWEWGIPQQSTFSGEISTPGKDSYGDLGGKCYVTGNGGNGGENDVDNGEVWLISPPLNLSDYQNPVLHFTPFFFNEGGTSQTGAPNDALEVYISNQSEEVLLEVIDESGSNWKAPVSIELNGLIDLTEDMHVSFKTSDLPGSGHIVEAGIDAFRIEEEPVVSADELSNVTELRIAPNPFAESTWLDMSAFSGQGAWTVSLFDMQGRLLWQQDGAGNGMKVGAELPAGIFLLITSSRGEILGKEKLVKIK